MWQTVSTTLVRCRRVALARGFFGAALITLLAVNPVQAQDQAPEELLEEGANRIMQAFELFLGQIPQYEAPEILPNGDIIIRRKNPKEGFQDRGPAEPFPAPPERPVPPDQDRT